MGHNLLTQGKCTKAEPFLRECLAIREQHLAEDWLRFNTLSMLGGALLGQQKYAEAEPLLLKGYEGMNLRKEQPFVVRRLREAVERVIRLYELTNQPEKAAACRRKL